MPKTNVVRLNDPQARLAAIPGEVAQAAAKTVEAAWTVGALLLEARELLADDGAFGTWRKTHITDPLGIAPRTQRTFMSIARTFKREALPHYLGLTALADVAALPDQAQDTALTFFQGVAAEGKRIPVSLSTSVCQRIRRDGCKVDELRRLYNPEQVLGITEVQADVERPAAPVVAGPVVIDAETGEVEGRSNQPANVAVANPRQSPEDWAKTVVQRIRRENGHRRDYLAALRAELATAGMLEVKGGSIGVEGTGKAAHIVVND